MVNSAAIPWNLFQNNVSNITIENVDPIPIQPIMRAPI